MAVRAGSSHRRSLVELVARCNLQDAFEVCSPSSYPPLHNYRLLGSPELVRAGETWRSGRKYMDHRVVVVFSIASFHVNVSKTRGHLDLADLMGLLGREA